MADELCPEKPETFLLFLSNGEVFVWDADAVQTLRRKYRIVGSLVGSLPSKPRQNVVFSLPLVLQAEEVSLLLEKKVAKLVVNDSVNSLPNEDTVKRFQEQRKQNVEEQIEKLKEIKGKKLEEFAEVIEEARKRKHKNIHSRKRKLPSDGEEEPRKKQRCLEESEGGHKWKSEAQEKTVYDNDCPLKECETRSNKGICPSPEETEKDYLCDSTLVCITSQHPPSLLETRGAKWTFPETELEKLRYQVYMDLWGKGYYITQGSKFGGDYLVYPSDPFRFHSYFVVTIISWKKNIHSLDLVSIGRLGSTVKKTSVLASVNISGKVIYTSIQWPGFT